MIVSPVRSTQGSAPLHPGLRSRAPLARKTQPYLAMGMRIPGAERPTHGRDKCTLRTCQTLVRSAFFDEYLAFSVPSDSVLMNIYRARQVIQSRRPQLVASSVRNARVLYIGLSNNYKISMSGSFHAEVRLWSEIKHDILRKYLRLFVNKLGASGRIYYIDGFAGQGKYDDGKEGSALIAARLAAEDAAKALVDGRIERAELIKSFCRLVTEEKGLYDFALGTKKNF